MGTGINVQIVSASGVGGVYPFVVVCFDGDIANELYKTEATTGGKFATWNHSQTLDLSANIKERVASGMPEPTYLTFFLFDTGTKGVPALGSAGVLLQTVKDDGRAQGDFPVVNGRGTLRLVVQSAEQEDGEEHDSRFSAIKHNIKDNIMENKTKFGVVGGSIVAGAAALALHEHKKKKKEGEEHGGEHGEKKKNSILSKIPGMGGSKSSESDEDGGVREVVGDSASSSSAASDQVDEEDRQEQERETLAEIVEEQAKDEEREEAEEEDE